MHPVGWAPLLARRSSDEYAPLPWRSADRRALAALRERADRVAPRAGLPMPAYLTSRCGTAATLRAVDAAHGGGFYAVPAEADPDAADTAFAGAGPVVDVQTHLVEGSRWPAGGAALDAFLRMVDPDRWGHGVDPARLSAGEWVAQVFGGSETAVALLTALPGLPEHMVLPNESIAATRDLVDRYAGSGRVLTHTIVHPNLGPAELDRMVAWRDALASSAWKVYTLWDPPGAGAGGFFLDDEHVGLPFLEHVRAIGPRIVCAHKGIAGPVASATPAGASPRDVGPAAVAFPDVQWLDATRLPPGCGTDELTWLAAARAELARRGQLSH